jgi:hypothetical protein
MVCKRHKHRAEKQKAPREGLFLHQVIVFSQRGISLIQEVLLHPQAWATLGRHHALRKTFFQKLARQVFANKDHLALA